jgi:hypothetical protein
MVKFTDRIRRKWLKTRGGGKGRKVTLRLDPESSKRLERLKAKLNKASDGELIALALKVLEHKRDEVVKKQIIKKIQRLRSEGDLCLKTWDKREGRGM